MISLLRALFRKREFVSYEAKYRDITVKACATVYSYNQRDCVEQLKQFETQVSNRFPERITITARSPY